jgi:hypothetical protein
MQAEAHPIRVRAIPSLGPATGKRASSARSEPHASEAQPARHGVSHHWRPPEFPCADS